MKGFSIPYKKMKQYLKKNIFQKFWSEFSKNVVLAYNAYSSFIINSRIIIHISDERIWLPLQKNVAIFSKK